VTGKASGIEFLRVECRDDFLAALDSFRPDLILSDQQLPAFDGITALHLARERAPDIPFILLSGSLNETTMVKYVQAGVWAELFEDRLRRSGSKAVAALAEQHRRQSANLDIERLRESEERYRNLFENNHAVMLLIDPETMNIVDANPAASLFYGWSRNQFRNKKISDINVLDSTTLHSEMARARSSLRNHFYFQHRLADGRLRDVEVLSATISLSGRPLLYSIIHDITERTQAENAWRRAQFCIDHASIGIFRIDEIGRILEVNHQACRSLGYTDEELRKLTIFDIDPMFNTETWQGHRSQMRAQQTGTIETQHRRKDGTIFPVEVTVNYFEYEGELFSVSFAHDITERQRHEKELQHLATHDKLTGLANRTLLHDRITQSIHYADRSNKMVAVLLLDLDRFKVINKSLSHNCGDRLLCSVAERLAGSVRKSDTVARLGGDEFVILLSEIGEVKDVGTTARKILKNLSRPYHLNNREITVTGSLGLSIYPRDGKDAETLLRNADVAMYQAKEEGDSFHYYTPEMDLRGVEVLDLEIDLRHALERDELLLHFQPKVNLENGTIIGAEALLRWCHPQRGLIAPGIFVPLAEETGLILPIGEWVLTSVCRHIKAWQEQRLPAIPIAANLSPRQFNRPGLDQVVCRILAETGIDPGLLELELTESMIMRDPQVAAATMHQLKNLGVSLALDDFGTGYSSLNYLRRFPVDALKIDRSFISDVAVDPSAAAVTTSIIAIAHSLDLQAVAEGVETREQLNFLRNCRCDSLQGFYFSRPLPAEEFVVMLQNGKRLT